VTLRSRIRAATAKPEAEVVAELLRVVEGDAVCRANAAELAQQWVVTARAQFQPPWSLASIMRYLPLTTPAGRALLTLTEALLRTRDPREANQLVAEQLMHFKDLSSEKSVPGLLRVLLFVVYAVGRQPLMATPVRLLLQATIACLSRQFVIGDTLAAALMRAQSNRQLQLCSYDMLGESARTAEEADQYYARYQAAIATLAEQAPDSLLARSGISVKLSALEPRYSLMQAAHLEARLMPRIKALARQAAAANLGFTLDAEEAQRLDIYLDIIAMLAQDEDTRSWRGLGVVVQAYHKSALTVINWLNELAANTGRCLQIRLVKGAYWDYEIAHAHAAGLPGFPVFTHKAASDVSYLACARRLLLAGPAFYPQFATHNALTIASVLKMAPANAAYEFQRLFGMGESLYTTAEKSIKSFPPVRVYAPVGNYRDLLPYLARRLLENGSSSSFVSSFLDTQTPPAVLLQDPVSALNPMPALPQLAMPRPFGMDLGNPEDWQQFSRAYAAYRSADLSVSHELPQLYARASRAQQQWQALPLAGRVACVQRFVQVLQTQRYRLLSTLVHETGLTVTNALSELAAVVNCATRTDVLIQKLPSGIWLNLPALPARVLPCQLLQLLVAGNAVVIYANAAEIPGLGCWAEIWQSAGLPQHLLQFTVHDPRIEKLPYLLDQLHTVGVAYADTALNASLLEPLLIHYEKPLVLLKQVFKKSLCHVVDSSAAVEQVVDALLADFLTGPLAPYWRQRIVQVHHLQFSQLQRVWQGALACLRTGEPVDPATDLSGAQRLESLVPHFISYDGADFLAVLKSLKKMQSPYLVKVHSHIAAHHQANDENTETETS
jgi:RHH-type transcriptional regulator, proline utilization regulon repressor / proline dehydrogenase / delta 1-pyrroline-5-carboxylate dehydrogenase